MAAEQSLNFYYYSRSARGTQLYVSISIFFLKHDEQAYCVVILGLFGFLRSESSILGVFEMEGACKLKMKDIYMKERISFSILVIFSITSKSPEILSNFVNFFRLKHEV